VSQLGGPAVQPEHNFGVFLHHKMAGNEVNLTSQQQHSLILLLSQHMNPHHNSAPIEKWGRVLWIDKKFGVQKIAGSWNSGAWKQSISWSIHEKSGRYCAGKTVGFDNI